MDYPLENLDPEKFQEFCQALLLKEFRDLQCFPVAQPDGGRDILSYYPGTLPHSFIVFQVKFVRRPQAEKDPHKWLIKILEDEAPKIKKQIPNGAKQFVLMTNIAGTAHPKSGSIDKVNHLLNNELGLPSVCWWRDDLNRRLDNAWDLKWVYPELMTGPDLIRSVIESGLSESRERRSNAIRAFIKDQFLIEQVVKFKQVDLQNRLLDLFIDVPIAPPQTAPTKKQQHRYHRVHEYVAYTTRHQQSISRLEDPAIDDASYNPSFDRESRENVGAATLLLHSTMQKEVPWIVLEGAPGQGKSTITQYLCQVHRMRVLGETEVFQSLPDDHKDETLDKLSKSHRESPVCLPFKIDLRDLSAWLSGKNPFSYESTESAPPQWNKSLESFLAALVRHHSGGFDFDVADLISIVKLSAVFFAFDGLDEVADINRRQEVVNEIISGINRLEANAASLQVVVTSRPAAFANSPGLPKDKFPHYQLTSVTRPLIIEYAQKWMRARKLTGREASEVKKILRDKLDQPHLRDLARNPMQLTILLSLMHTRGSSLPDKRTALYYNYVDLFFSREAEKNLVVRQHRDLLLDIHKHLAWILHSEAEQGGGNGSISEDRLQTLLESYLSNEGYDPSLAKTLLTGALERIVALVSRVEGTYEFEVQPLREYFAASYLYETAPHSSLGNEKRGTKPDRFDAIARNFYWLNVTRFYAGCYDKGELPSLIDRLQVLIEAEGYRLISHPRILAATLLSDWVFTQHPRSVRTVISMILGRIGLRYILPSRSRRLGQGEPMVLPKDCGKDELIKYCFTILGTEPPMDYALDIIDLVKANASVKEINDLWFGGVITQKGEKRTQWLKYGLYLSLLSNLSLEDLSTVLSDEPINPQRFNLLNRAKRTDFFESNEQRFSAALEAILSGEINAVRRQPIVSYIDLISQTFDAARYAIAFSKDYPKPIPLDTLWGRDLWLGDGRVSVPGLGYEKISKKLDFLEVKKIDELVQVARIEAKRSALEWSTTILPWDNLVEKSRSLWGDHWVNFHLANISSSIKSDTETCTDYSNLFDRSHSLCKRSRYARLRAGTASWWQKHFNMECSGVDLMFLTLVLVTWGSRKTLSKLLIHIDEFIKKLSAENWNQLYDSAKEAIRLTQPFSNSLLNFKLEDFPGDLDAKTVALIGLRAKEQSRIILYSKYLKEYNGLDLVTLKFYQDVALELFSFNQENWTSVREAIRHSYLNGVVSEPYLYHRFFQKITEEKLSIKIAEEISEEPDYYPSFLVAAAEDRCKEAVAPNIVPVGEIARREKWFEIN